MSDVFDNYECEGQLSIPEPIDHLSFYYRFDLLGDEVCLEYNLKLKILIDKPQKGYEEMGEAAKEQLIKNLPFDLKAENVELITEEEYIAFTEGNEES